MSRYDESQLERNMRYNTKNSINHSGIEYGTKKKKLKPEQVKRAKIIVALTLAGTIAIGYLIKNDKRRTVTIPDSEIEFELSSKDANRFHDIISKKVDTYTKKMDMYADKDNRIENYQGRDIKRDDANVSYDMPNYRNMVKHIVDASKISEIDIRCTILAAYKIVNEPYRQEFFDNVFKLLADENEIADEYARENINKNYGWLRDGSTQAFLEYFGYVDLNDYQMHERESIEDALAIQEHLKNTTSMRK